MTVGVVGKFSIAAHQKTRQDRHVEGLDNRRSGLLTYHLIIGTPITQGGPQTQQNAGIIIIDNWVRRAECWICHTIGHS